MENIIINESITASNIALGCMRIANLTERELDVLLDTAIENGVNFFDHADIYGRGNCEKVFGEYLKKRLGLREKIFIQSKCAIHDGQYDFSKEHIIKSVDGSLSRLNVDYLDCLLLHRPDALMQPEEVAEAFLTLKSSGKVKNFGVSNHNAMQIELLKTAVKEPLKINQLQFSIVEAGLVSSGFNVNTKNAEGVMRDGGFLEYARINKITVQAWSPFQYGFFKGSFIDNSEFKPLNDCLERIGRKYGLTKTGVATAWLLRHPANIQVIAGTTNAERLKEICSASSVKLERSEWYEIYRSVGHYLP